MDINMGICQIRAHHGMCLAFFRGKGYSDEFTEHMGKMRRFLDQNPVVRILAGTDEICGPCPNNEGGICSGAAKTEGYDRKVLSLCGIREGSELFWQDFAGMVRERVLEAGKREEICGDCQWNSICSKK